jgi:ribosome-associated protein
VIRINNNLSIEADVSFTYARSPGPGGQNVNKVATKATLTFDVVHSPALSEGQRSRLRQKLPTRITKEGLLRISSWRGRSQVANRRYAIERFRELLADALRPVRIRKKTRPSRASKERRLQDKRHRSDVKNSRRRRYRRDDD